MRLNDADTDPLHTVASLLGQPETTISEDANLIELGLDSVSMMRLAGQWRRTGLPISFAEMISAPTLAHWRALLARNPAWETPASTGPTPVDEAAPFDLAIMQHAYWVGRAVDQLYGGVAAHFYNEFDSENLDTQRLEKAVRALVSRHGMLRMQVLPDGQQRILERSTWAGLCVHDLRTLSAEQAELALEARRQKLSRRCMPLEQGEVFDVQVSLLPPAMRPRSARLHLNLDMVAADALSVRVLLADLAQAYAMPDEPLPAIDYSYPRYAADRRNEVRETRRRADREYWQSRLDTLPAAPKLPMVGAAARSGAATVRRHRWLEPAQAAALVSAAHKQGLTPAMALAALYAEVLTAWSEEPAFLLNLPLFDREPLHPDINLLTGDFTSSLLIAWDGAIAGTFAERARRLQAQFHADAGHASYAGVEVLRDMSRARGVQILAPVVFTSALGLGELYSPLVRRHLGAAVWITSQSPQVWLDLQVSEVDGGMLVNLDAREEAFEPGVVDAMFGAYERMLLRLLSSPEAWTSPVPALLPEMQLHVRAAANDTAASVENTRLHDRFFDHARRHPDADALRWGRDGAMSYGELSLRALGVAGYLVSQGVGRGDVVALRLPRGPNQIVAVLGVLASGAAYLPMGADQPPVRAQRILQAAGAVLVLDMLPAQCHPPLAAPASGDAGDLAYIMYTSGSTGEPKGVEISHLAASATLAALQRRLALDQHDRTLALSALEFDLSVYDIFAPLSTGAAVVCIDESARRDPQAWHTLLRRHNVTILNCVPALLDMLLTGWNGVDQAPLRAVLTGGDWIGLDLPCRLRDMAPGCRFLALGGATETTIYSNIYEVDEVDPNWTSIPYGKPLDNEQLRIADPLGRDCPDLVAGELWIGGISVACGYRGDAEKTADRFLTHGGVRWYRTGDRARYWPDGNIEFLGRNDLQKKLRGHRVELGEIEAVLESWPGAGRAVVVLSCHGLAAAITGSACPPPREGLLLLRGAPQSLGGYADLPEFLAARLPPVMQPEWLWPCASFPLTSNGKIDRAAILAAVDAQQVDEAGLALTAPATPLEHNVAAVWSDILGVPNIGREHNFFLLGGDSLLATRLVRRLDEHGIGGATLARLFGQPVFADFVAGLHEQAQRAEPVPWICRPQDRHLPFPPTDIQRAYWLGRDPGFTLGGVGAHFYREYDTTGVDLSRLERAVDALVARHDMLRAVFDEQGMLRILPEVPAYAIEVIDVPEEEDPSTALVHLRETQAHYVFDPQQWPLFSIRAVRCGAFARLAISHDNLTLDARSILLFYSELSALYDMPQALDPAPSATFRDYILHCQPDLQEQARARAHWDTRLPTLPPAPQLPLLRQPETVGVPRFVRYEGRLNGPQWDNLSRRAAGYGVTPSAVLLAAFADILGRWSEHADLTLNLTLFDRHDVHPDIHRMMGDFTSLTLVSHHPVAGEPWLDRVRRMQLELASSLDHRALATPTLLRDLARLQGVPAVAMPVVFTSALGVPGGTGAPTHGPFSRQIWGLSQTPQVWLDHQVVETADGIALNWDAVANLFPSGMVQAMFDTYMAHLAWLSEHAWTRSAPDLLPAAQRLRRDAQHAVDAVPPTASLHDAFFALASKDGQRTALRWGTDGAMTYAQLAERALRIAQAVAQLGAGPGDVVAVQLPKGSDQIAAVLGVLAAGAAYLPIGVDQPSTRRDRILDRAGARTILTDADPASLPSGLRAASLAQALRHPPAPRAASADPVCLAYVIFTSGSTGEPKGVEITHGAAMNTIMDINRRFGVGPHDSVLAVSALDFDLSVYDIFGLLSAGGSLVLVNEDERRDALAWQALLRRYAPTLWNSAPALLDMLLTAGASYAPGRPLRLALVSGDWVDLDLPARTRGQHPGCRFVALGGATEASIWSNFFEVDHVDPAWRSVPYGYPLTNQRLRVVNAAGDDCPDWVAGELWIGGSGVALGYRGAPELTATQYVRDADGVRWYRTGDQARYWPDGMVEFLGRKDGQVKIRGHRIELGEIEAVLRAYPGLRSAHALVAGLGTAGRLAAAVVPETDDAPDLGRLRAHLRKHLPAHMVPEPIQVVRQLPLNTNGKVDRAALAAALAGDDRPVEPAEAPGTEWECAIADIWSELLDTAAISRNRSFFELGGDSLTATRFIERLRQRHGLSLPLRTLFLQPILRDVAAELGVLSGQTEYSDLEEGVL